MRNVDCIPTCPYDCDGTRCRCLCHIEQNEFWEGRAEARSVPTLCPRTVRRQGIHIPRGGPADEWDGFPMGMPRSSLECRSRPVGPRCAPIPIIDVVRRQLVQACSSSSSRSFARA